MQIPFSAGPALDRVPLLSGLDVCVWGAFFPGDAHSLPRPTVLDLSTQNARTPLPSTGSALKQLKLTFQKSPGHTTLENQSQHSGDTAPAHSRTRGLPHGHSTLSCPDSWPERKQQTHI